MKKNRFLKRILFAVILSPLFLSCNEKEEILTMADFSSIASSYNEAKGIVIIPLRSASVEDAGKIQLTLGGTAVQGKDYELVGVTAQGVEIKIIDDKDFEPNETIRVQTNLSGNNIHTITIVSDCQDIVGIPQSFFAGSWAALEDYGASGTFGPYDVSFVQDATDKNKFKFSNFYGSGAQYTANLVFDMVTGSVKFPDQTIGAPTFDKGPLTASSGTFVIDLCNNKVTLTINLTYDGGPWVYRFTKK